jgi:hypothetical protein
MNHGSLEFLLTPVLPEHEQLLSGISELTDTLLWICPGINWDNLSQRFSLEEAFPELRGILWQRAFKFHASRFGPGKILFPDVNKYWPEDIEILATIETALAAEDRASVSRIAWMPQSWSEQWRWISDQTCELSFVPNVGDVAVRWTRVALGLTWLKELGPNREPDPPSEPDAVIRSYVRTTMRLKGVAILRWRADTYSGLLCFGTNDQLHNAASVLGSQGARVAFDLDFHRLWTRGLYLEAEMG